MAKKNELPRPCGPRVLVRRDAPVTHSQGGIIIPGAAQQSATTGIVLAIGSGPWSPDSKTTGKSPVAVKDRVAVGGYSLTEIEHYGEKLLIVDGHSILAVLP